MVLYKSMLMVYLENESTEVLLTNLRVMDPDLTNNDLLYWQDFLL